jgi:hypothetical protein
MDLRPLAPVALACLGALMLALTLRVMRRRRWVDPSGERVRRGTGRAILGLQQFIEPSVEYVIRAENVEQVEEDDPEADGDDAGAIRDDLSASLGRSPIDPEEVRRLLTRAARSGLDWEGLYDEAVRSELGSRPFRAPSIPPAWKVAPRGDARRIPAREPMPNAGQSLRGTEAQDEGQIGPVAGGSIL